MFCYQDDASCNLIAQWCRRAKLLLIGQPITPQKTENIRMKSSKGVKFLSEEQPKMTGT